MDLTAFYLTAKKSWHEPMEENVTLYAVSGLRCLVSLFAMENFSLVTMIYPTVLMIANSAIAIMIVWRRSVRGDRFLGSLLTLQGIFRKQDTISGMRFALRPLRDAA